MSSQQQLQLIKSNILIIGDHSIGKTSLIRRFVDQKFEQSYVSTIGSDLSTKDVQIDSKFIIRLLLYDIGGQEQFHNRVTKYAPICNAFVICYDITNPTSFLHIDYWYNLLVQTLGDRWQSLKHKVMLVGTKSDLVIPYAPQCDAGQVDYQREQCQQVSVNYLKQACEHFQIPYAYETSAKNGIQIQEVFTELAKICKL